MTVVTSVPAIVICRPALPSTEAAAAAVASLVTNQTPSDDNLYAIVYRSEETLQDTFNRLQDCGLGLGAMCWLAPDASLPAWLDVIQIDADRVKLEIRGYYPLPPELLCPVMPV